MPSNYQCHIDDFQRLFTEVCVGSHAIIDPANGVEYHINKTVYGWTARVTRYSPEEGTIELVATDGIREESIYDEVGAFATLDGTVIFQKTDGYPSSEFQGPMVSVFEKVLSIAHGKEFKFISEVGSAVAKSGRAEYPDGVDFERIKHFYGDGPGDDLTPTNITLGIVDNSSKR